MALDSSKTGAAYDVQMPLDESTPKTAMPLDPFDGAFMEPKEGGPCEADSSFRGLETVLVLRRYATVFVALVRDAVTGDLTIAPTNSASPYIAFDEGYKEAGNDTGLLPAGTNLTRAETDGYTEGALAPDAKFTFRIVGMGLQFGQPFRVGTVGADAAARTYDPFWSLAPYGARIVRALADAAHVTYRHGKADFGYEMGKLSFYPSMSSMLGADGLGVSIGNPLANAFIPLRVPDYSGGPEDDDAITVELAVDRTVNVVQDAAVPTVAGTYLLPITIELYGHTLRNNRAVTRDNVREMMADELKAIWDNIDTNNPDELRLAAKLMQALTRRAQRR